MTNMMTVDTQKRVFFTGREVAERRVLSAVPRNFKIATKAEIETLWEKSEEFRNRLDSVGAIWVSDEGKNLVCLYTYYGTTTGLGTWLPSKEDKAPVAYVVGDRNKFVILLRSWQGGIGIRK